MEMALAFEGKPVFITDSGDNVTSGATGWNTFILRQVLAVPQLTKRFLFSNICDPDTWQLLDSLPSGTETQITLGVGADANSAPVTLDVIVRSKGSLRGYLMHDHDAHYGDAVVVSVKGLPIEISVASTRQTMCEKHQFDALGIDWDDYDVIVVKQGYIFPDLKAKGQLCIMSLTGGATPPRYRLNSVQADSAANVPDRRDLGDRVHEGFNRLLHHRVQREHPAESDAGGL